MRKGIKYGLWTTGWLITGVSGILLAALLLIQTTPVKRLLAKKAGALLSESINGELSVGKLEGNFFSNLTIRDVVLTQNGDTLAGIDALHARYNLWGLLQKTADVHIVEIISPRLFIRQENDSVWNIQHILPPGTDKKNEKNEPSGTFYLRLPEFRIENGFIGITARDSIIPQTVEKVNAELSVLWTARDQQITLNHFSFLTGEPGFNLKQLRFSLQKKGSYLELDDFLVETTGNTLRGEAVFDKAKRSGTATLNSTALYPAEFSVFIPRLQIPATPELKLQATIEDKAAQATLEMTEQNQKISLQFTSHHLVSLLFGSAEQPPDYFLAVRFEQADLAHWLGIKELPRRLNGSIRASGTGIQPGRASLSVTGRLNNSVFYDTPFELLHFDFRMDEGNLAGWMEGNGEFGSFRLDPAVQDMLHHPVYRARITTSNLDLKKLTGNENLHSGIHLTADIAGEGYDPEKISAEGRITMQNSHFQEVRIDSLLATATYSNNNLSVHSLEILTQGAGLKAKGNFSSVQPFGLQLEATLSGLDEFRTFLPDSTINTKGRIRAELTGNDGTFTLQATAELDSTRYGENLMEHISINANGTVSGDDTLLHAAITARNIRTNQITVDTMTARMTGNTDSLFLQSDLISPLFTTRIETGLNPKMPLILTISGWETSLKNQHWILQRPPAIIEINDRDYRIKNLRLVSDQNEEEQFIAMDGSISRTSQQDFSLEVGNLDLEQLVQHFIPGQPVTGKLNIRTELSGEAGSPEMHTGFSISGVSWKDWPEAEISGEIDYGNNRLSLETGIKNDSLGQLEASASVPLHVALDSMKMEFNKKDSVRGRATIDHFSMAFLEETGISGFLDGELELTGTVEAPRPNGYISLQDGTVRLREYGIDYSDIGGTIRFSPDKINVDSLLVRSPNGNISGSGRVDFTKNLWDGNINQSMIALNFNGFEPFTHRQLNMEIDGTVTLEGKKGEVIYGGDVTIPRSEIYLPMVMRMMGRMSVPEMPEPLLVREMEKEEQARRKDTLTQIPPERSDPPGFIEDLRGKLRIRIPRNTWIKNKDLYMEISGDLEVIKSAPYFELFGSVDVVRGQYDFLGKTFVIDEGTISFRGGEEPMPHTDLKATYAFRNQRRVEQELTLLISGTTDAPEVKFLLDDQSVSEGDAISYIFFGKSMNELTINEQEDVPSGESESLARKAAASLLSAQLTGFLGDRLAVDYLEIKSESGWDDATVVLGKYITNDLFMSYEQRFGETREKDMAKYEVKLEYELFRFLFFELNNSSRESGFDVIFKFDAK